MPRANDRPAVKERSRAMKILYRILFAIFFVVAAAFALKNTHEVALRFFSGVEVHSPLIILVGGFFLLGATMGILAMVPTLVHYRRELGRQKKLLTSMQKESDARELARTQAPAPDGFVPN